MTNPPPPTDIMVGWICVLQAEYRAAISILDERYDSTGLVRGQGDKNHYVLGRVGNHAVAINLPPAATYGQLHATRIALDMRSTFPRVRFVLLVGIAGGAPSAKHEIRLGDVVLGTSVVPYATGKETDAGFERHAMVRAPPTELLDALTFLDERLWSEDVVLAESVEKVRGKAAERAQADFRRPCHDRFYRSGYMHQETGCDCLEADLYLESSSQHNDILHPRADREAGKTTMQLFQGAIGSDNIVMKNAQTRDEIAQREKILCFEMEATGVMDVVPCLPIRGISDYADGHKNDGWHLYAALTAATCARELLLSFPPRAVAQLSLTLPGTLVDRYISGAVSNPNAFSGSEIERLTRTRQNLMERHAFLEELMRPEVRRLKYEKASGHSSGDVRSELERLKRFQHHLKLHLQDLDQSLNQRDHLLRSSADPSEREEYERLKTQVQKDEEAMDSLAGLVDTTSTLLTTLGRISNDANLSTAGTMLVAGREYLGFVMQLLFPTAAISRGLYRGIRGLGTGGPSRPSDVAEMQAMLTYV
ncbi:nucleoside phosphorylase domain-containing protein [Aspergillus carlsbadensis]|nr:nucleoside phosphorylase domain-containing protein [Aspergillus carlsbadensis]